MRLYGLETLLGIVLPPYGSTGDGVPMSTTKYGIPNLSVAVAIACRYGPTTADTLPEPISMYAVRTRTAHHVLSQIGSKMANKETTKIRYWEKSWKNS